MNRREFINASLAASSVVALGAISASAAEDKTAPASNRDFFELRAYRLKPNTPHELLDTYLEKALIPTLNSHGIAAVGVFRKSEPNDAPSIWVLIPHTSLDSVARVNALNADPELLSAAADYLTTPTKENPAFDRLDSWLLRAFAGMPQLAVPALAREKKARIFELRTYDSFSEARGRKKVEMFNAGEIDLMKDLNLSPVFYGEGVVGSDLPHLTYMLCSPDRATHTKNWNAFMEHPVWVKLKDDPQYADTVSKVTSRFLEPAPFSQI